MAASNAAPLPSCKPSRNGMPASRRTPVRSPNGKMMPEPGRYSRARKLAAWAVQARRASELTSDSFHDIEDDPLNPQTPVMRRARIILVLACKRAGTKVTRAPAANAANSTTAMRITRVVPAIWSQVGDKDGRARGVQAPDVEQGGRSSRKQRPPAFALANATRRSGAPDQQRPSRDPARGGEVVTHGHPPIVIARIPISSLRDLALVDGGRGVRSVVKLERVAVVILIVREPRQRSQRGQDAANRIACSLRLETTKKYRQTNGIRNQPS